MVWRSIGCYPSFLYNPINMQLLPPLLTTLLVCTVSATNPGQASNFDVSAAVAEEHSCDSVCQETLNQTNAADLGIFDSSFDFDFYATADNFTSSSPSSRGSLLKIKPLNGTALSIPAGVSIYKFQYTSQDVNGSLVPATGFIAFPFARPQKSDPFKLVAFAHGTTGVFHGCAPSTSSYLFDYNSWTPLLLAGYAVVATDYAGLGNNMTTHQYIASAANANDIYWSVVAAHEAFPSDLTHEWVSIGHSQGGGATYKLSEHELVQDDSSGYLGGVSIGPITKIYDSVVEGLRSLDEYSGSNMLGEIGSVVLGVQSVLPNYTAPFLGNTMRQRIELANIGQLCNTALSGLASNLSMTDLIGKISATDVIALQGFQKINAPAQGDKASKPLLLIQSQDDTVVLKSLVSKAYEASCSIGNPVRLSLYPGLDHSATVGASAPEWLAFIEGLFSSTVNVDDCVNGTSTPFDLEHAATSTH